MDSKKSDSPSSRCREIFNLGLVKLAALILIRLVVRPFPLDSLLAAAIFDYISFVQQDQGEETPAASASPESMDHLRLERLVVDLVSSSVEDGYVSVSCP